MRNRLQLLMMSVLIVHVSSIAQGQVWVADTTSSVGSDKVHLQSLSVLRGGTSYDYDFGDLTLGEITAVNTPGRFRTSILSPDGYPAGGAPNGLLSDTVLNSGLLDPGKGDGNFQAGDDFVELTFSKPVVNGPGGDLLLAFITFDFGSWESDPGPYWLAPSGGSPTKIDRAADMDLGTIKSIPYFAYLDGGPTDPSDFLATNVQHTGGLGNSTSHARPSLQLVDLSELGILPGNSIPSLRIWDDDFSNGNSIYPTLIAGLPAVPEPSTWVMAMFGAIACGEAARRRRKRIRGSSGNDN